MGPALRRPVAAVPAALTAVLLGLLLLLLAVPAAAAGGITEASAALKSTQVYVDPSMTGRFSESQAADLAGKLKDADKPIFVAVVPATDAYPAQTLARDLRTETGIVGVYAIWRGEEFRAFSDRAALAPVAADRIAGAASRAHPGDINGTVNDFVDQAIPQTRGHGVTDGGTGVAAVVVPVALLLLIGAGVFVMLRRSRRRKEERQRAELAQLRTVVDEDITAFGEELDRLDFSPGAPDADDRQRTDYAGALDSYDRAKQLMDAAGRPSDVRAVTEALENGRFALATLAARREDRPLPERRVPCFFDPRHGPSARDVDWAPPGGAVRSVPACAADAARLESGLDPDVRTVETDRGRQPYWNAGPVYSPWAGGYYGSGLLPGLLVGTLLGSAMAAPGGAWAADGGDYSGADFHGDDFGGGFDGGGGGFGGGGDFGGGGGDFGGGF
ncbi:hypothetical protein [Kitasatospora camelliae]|uniref:Membrane protein YgcG n=1 Tax=Kitasatospora camelliae TaxID=3156397 RepID=A0AAU8K0A3_9ACTN